uniref:Uncharacterized protein n=1 Tax=Solanum tuberosum TaxID=4113 RepID=M1DIA7_SOLTU
MADPRAYYPNYRRPVGASSTSHALPPRCYEDLPLQAIRRPRPLSAGRISNGTPSPIGTSPQLFAMSIGDSSSKQSDAMAAAPSATPDAHMPALAPGQKDRLGRFMIEPDGSSCHPVKDAARALKDCVRRLYTHAYYSWSEIPNSIRQALFNEFKTMCTWKSSLKAMSKQAKKARGSLKGGSLNTGGAKTVGTITREMEIKEQVLNHARRPTTSSPAEDIDDDIEEEEEDDFVDATP